MDGALVMFNVGSNLAFARAVETAHKMSGDRNFLVDFPGIDNPAWSVSRRHSLGRAMVMYADAGFCGEVDRELGALGRDDVTTVVVAQGDLASMIDDGDKRGRRVVRRPLRNIGRRAAEKSAARLAAYLARKGVEIKRPIEVRDVGFVEADGRIKVAVGKIAEEDKQTGVVDDKKKYAYEYVTTYLVLESSRGGRFTNAILRDVMEREVLIPEGRRDSYGFGGIVPNLSERRIVAELVGGDIL